MAIRALLSTLLVSAVALAASSPQSGRNDTIRIIGGVDAHEGDFPYIVSLQVQKRKDSQHLCGGSLLDATIVLTAGHCVRTISEYGYKTADVRVRVGSLSYSSGGNLLRTESLIAHPDYVHLHAEHGSDVGIIKLLDPVPDSDEFEFAILSQDRFR